MWNLNHLKKPVELFCRIKVLTKPYNIGMFPLYATPLRTWKIYKLLCTLYRLSICKHSVWKSKCANPEHGREKSENLFQRKAIIN